MPHIVVKYSDNAPATLDWTALLLVLHDSLAEQDTVTPSQIKTYAFPLSACIVGDSTRPDGMIHIQIRLLKGRSDALRKAMALALHDAVRAYTNKVGWACALSIETVELHSETYCSSYQ
ncbi:MAG: hypothetical protein HRT35_06670 [Algicola sp.]|nr:hypothetical protein [Algicola sp.]